jgi:hypothetical protein
MALDLLPLPDYWVYHCEYFWLIDLQIVLHLKILDQIGW